MKSNMKGETYYLEMWTMDCEAMPHCPQKCAIARMYLFQEYVFAARMRYKRIRRPNGELMILNDDESGYNWPVIIPKFVMLTASSRAFAPWIVRDAMLGVKKIVVHYVKAGVKHTYSVFI